MLLSQGEDADKEPEDESEGRPAAEKPSAKSSNSLESLYSGQSSSSTSLHGTNKNNKKKKQRRKTPVASNKSAHLASQTVFSYL